MSGFGWDTASFSMDFPKKKLGESIDKKWIKIIHGVDETLPHLNMKFCWYFAHFCV